PGHASPLRCTTFPAELSSSGSSRSRKRAWATPISVSSSRRASAATAPGRTTASGFTKTRTPASVDAAPRLQPPPKPRFRPASTTRAPVTSTGPPLLTTTTSTPSARSASTQRCRTPPLSYATTIAVTVMRAVSPSVVKIRLGGAVSVRAAPREHGRQGLREDRDVEPDRPVLEVVEVEAHEVVERQLDPTGDLPQPRHPGQDEVALAVPVLELHEIAQRQRPRPDERHLAAQHVQHLRQLVDRVAPQHAADRGDARVVLDLEKRPRRLVRRLERGLPLGCVDVHRPELEHAELALAEADAAVAVEDRPGRVELDGERDHEPERRGSEHDQRPEHEVERPLHGPVEPGEDGRTQLEERHALPRDVLGALRQEVRRRR